MTPKAEGIAGAGTGLAPQGAPRLVLCLKKGMVVNAVFPFNLFWVFSINIANFQFRCMRELHNAMFQSRPGKGF